jgi:hypothetical protein
MDTPAAASSSDATTTFGATWVQREQARRAVLRPWVERAASASRTVLSLARPWAGR